MRLPTLICWLGLAASAVGWTADRYVAPGGVDAPGCLSPGAPCLSLGFAVAEAADSGDIIHLAAGTYAESVDFGKNLRLQGAGASVTILDGGFSTGGMEPVLTVRIGAVSPAAVSIDAVTIQNGRGGIFSYGVALTVTNSVVTRNDSTFSVNGGGISVEAGRLLLADSLVSENTASQGGGILLTNRATGFIERTRVSGNLAPVGGGGGLHISRGSGSPSTFASLAVVDSSFTDNSCAAAGGGLYALEAAMDVYNATFSGNSADVGGGMYIGRVSGLRTDVDPLTNATFSGNSARSGGGLYVAGRMHLSLASGTLADNVASMDGGGIWCESSATISIRNSIVAGNSAPIGPDCLGSLDSGGYNLIADVADCGIAGFLTGNLLGVDPVLGPLADNGGPLWTQALLATSPARDAGNPTGCSDARGGSLVVTDARHAPRPASCRTPPLCDMGAWEGCPGSTTVPTLYESRVSTPIVIPVNAVATPPASPYDHVPLADPELYYAMDDGAGLPPELKLVKEVSDCSPLPCPRLLIHF